MQSDVVIAGGGVIGCALAYELAVRGVGVTVLERDTLGAHASTVAAGMLAPLSESASPDARFELGMRSLARFAELAVALKDETGVDIELLPSGTLRVALAEADEIELRRAEKWQRAQGVSVEWLEAATAREREPALAPTIRGALWSDGEQQVNPKRLLVALAQAAGRRGVRFLEGTPMLGLITAGGRVQGVRTPSGMIAAQTVVLAAGPWTGALGAELGLALPVTPKRGQLLHLHATPQPLRHMLGADHCYLVPRADGTIIVGATVEDAGYDRRPSAAGIAYLLGILPYVAPIAATTEFRAVEVGLRPWSADGLPLLGNVTGHAGLVVATGHGRNGILLAPITAQLLARLIVDGRDEIPPSCQANRFAREEAIAGANGASATLGSTITSQVEASAER
jgi:glycine oxidase